MNFFKHQDAARKRTGLLVVLLLLAVVSLIAVTVFVVGVFLYFLQSHSTSVSAYQAQTTSLSTHLSYLATSELTLWVAVGVLSVVAAGTLYKYLQLSGGGKRVAESLGGRPLSYEGASTQEARVLNVVEEMAIASGNPVPPVYLIDEPGINAFAAGMSRRDAVIGVTRGCIETLNRDELQGVIAHEFSHIHNGDMRLNMRLVAVLHGILLIGLIGYYVLHGSGGRRHYYSSSRSKGQGAQLSLAMALMAIGYGGTFFGNIIKAAVSRQREFLADASAVQFTRNPEGIGNALKKIGGYSAGSMLGSGAAAQFSHMYFGQGIKTSFNALMATHPPLHQRIKRVLPKWNGSYINPEVEPSAAEAAHHTPESAAAFAGPGAAQPKPKVANDRQFTRDAIERIGESDYGELQKARQMISDIPSKLRDAAHEPFSARALIYCLLLSDKNDIRDVQVEQLQGNAHPATFKVAESLYGLVYQLPREQHLTLIDMSMPALKRLSQPQYQVFRKNLVALIQADRRIELFEWCLYRIVTNTVEAKTPEPRFSLRELTDEISLVFSLIVRTGGSESPGGAFQRGVESLGFKNVKFTLSSDTFSFQKVDTAINRLAQLKLLQKPRFLKAVGEVIVADGVITPVEAELFRALADSLDCPVPPLELDSRPA